MAVKKKAAAKKAAKPAVRPRRLPDTLASPDELRDRVASLVEAWQNAADSPNPANADRLAKLSADLETGARSVREQAEALAESVRISAVSLKRIRAAVPGAAAATEREVVPRGKESLFEVEDRAVSFDIDSGIAIVKAPAEPDLPLESFFQQVAGSVVRAQQRLDLASLSYSQELKDSPIPPSLFSIPKVTAEIKLGLSVEKGSNLLVTLFGKPENTTNFSESTVSFDVVASAPPPGGTGVYAAPVPSFLVVGPERDTVAAAIHDISDLIRTKTGVDLSANPSTWLRTAIVVRAGSEALPAASRADYLFIKRGDTPDKPAFTVRFNLAKPREAAIVNVSDADLKLALFDLVARVREWESLVTLPLKT
jgi:hypothetical protein